MADSIYTQWSAYAAEHIEPEHHEGVVIPALILEHLGLPEELFESVGRIYDEAFRTAIRYAEHVAQHLAARNRGELEPMTTNKPDLYDGSALMAAVEAVLALHVPFERQARQFCGVHDSGAKFGPLRVRAVNRCRDCREVTKRVCAACGPICNDVAWPCATVLAIRKALGAEEMG